MTVWMTVLRKQRFTYSARAHARNGERPQIKILRVEKWDHKNQQQIKYRNIIMEKINSEDG